MRSVRIILGWLVFAVLAVGVAGAAALGGRGGRGTAPGSSFRADESGLLAARRVLEQIGRRVGSRRGAKLPDGTGQVLVRVEGLEVPKGFTPAAEAPAEERAAEGAALDQWVKDGNAVLLVGSRTPSGTVWPLIVPRARDAVPRPPETPPVRPAPASREDPAKVLARMYGENRPVVSKDDGRDVREICSLAGAGDPWISERLRVVVPRGGEVLAKAPTDSGEDAPVIVEEKRGRGRVVVVADPFFLSNVRLANSDNAAWLAALVERLSPDGDVWFDDRAVGLSATRGVMSLFAEAGLGPAVAAGALLLLLVWWRTGPSDAPDRRVRERPQYRPETIAMLRAGLYADCLAAQDVRRIVRDEVARRIGRGDGVGCDRALAMLGARDPARAERIRLAIDAMPSDPRIAPQRHPDAWCVAVTRVWRELDDGGQRR